jgi:hypothetical protein
LTLLCRYITRPAIANERLKRNRAGQVVLQLKSPYKDGTTHIVMEPLEFMEHLSEPSVPDLPNSTNSSGIPKHQIELPLFHSFPNDGLA